MTERDRARLAENFSDWEFRCRCGCGACWVDWRFLEGLEELRAVEGRPIHILSGCRCPRHNKARGGTDGSFHLTRRGGQPVACQAGDIVIAGLPVRRMFRLARQIPVFENGGIGVYPGEGFIHLDNRGRKARWARMAKGEPYINIPRNLY